jgi:hypothetical protein
MQNKEGLNESTDLCNNCKNFSWVNGYIWDCKIEKPKNEFHMGIGIVKCLNYRSTKDAE